MFKLLQKLQELKPEFVGHTHPGTEQPTGISIDTRTLASGELYIALRGENYDGHAFVENALNNGAIACLVDRIYWQQNKSVLAGKPLVVVSDTLLALQRLANAYRREFSLPVIGLTGTNGKTTTKEMLAAVLSQAGPVCKTGGNFNNHIGVPLTLFGLDKSHGHAVIEMGTNHFGEISALCNIAEPDAGLITNIGLGHTEFLCDLDGVAKAKMELFDFLHPKGTIFANLDDPMIAMQAGRFNYSCTYGLNSAAKIRAEQSGLDENGFPAMLVEGVEIRLNLVGSHNLINALAAVAVGLEFGLEMSQIKNGLHEVSMPSNRMEVIRTSGITILNDCYNANPESTLAALATLAAMKSVGQKWLVLGDMLELGEQADVAHYQVGSVLADYKVNVLAAYGPLSTQTVRAVKKNKPPVEAKHFADKKQLLRYLKQNISNNDILLIKGSRGMKMEEIVTGLMGNLH